MILLRSTAKCSMTRLLTTLFCALAVAALGQAVTNGTVGSMLPPAAPTSVISNLLQRRLAAPSAVRSKITVQFEYTNVVYPFYVSTNITGGTNGNYWTLATNVSCVTVSATFPMDPAVAAKFYTVGCPVYYAPATAGATN